MPKPLPPQMSRLRRLRVGAQQTVEAHMRDQRHCFHVHAAPESRLPLQVVGPRILSSWAYHLEDEEEDLKDCAEGCWGHDLSCEHGRAPSDFA